jgi:CheY-like chemotaxis protein
LGYLVPIDSNDLEKQDFVKDSPLRSIQEHGKGTMKNKVNAYRKLDLLSETIQHNSSEGQINDPNKDSLRTERIMLVEDEDDIIFLFKMILESDVRLRVDSFNEPLAALYNFEPGLYDLVMIDIVMPKMNGYELYHKIRKLDNKVKICFLTASEKYLEEIRKEVLSELDVNCFIRKPIANEDLIRRVKDILTIQ